ncbi:MAG: hypothetical protein P8Y69_06410 [Gammaproteobacteria bacterium]
MDPKAPHTSEDPLVARIASSLGLPAAVARRVIDDVIAYYRETPEEYVARRHRELTARGLKNADIYRRLAEEVAARPFAGPVCSVRQIRRMIYG